MYFYIGETAIGLLNHFRNQPFKTTEEEVLHSLTCLLNTKKSFGAWQKELGLEDYSHGNNSNEILQKMAEDISTTIKTYEKRFKLESVQVSFFHSFSHFIFELNGELEREKKIFYVRITKKNGIVVTA